MNNILKPWISIISPVYRSSASITTLVEEIKECLADLNLEFEIILIDDGSPDGSWQVISETCIADERVKGIKLSRNFGQHNAITAGLKVALGEKIIIMDSDLQDNPRYIPLLISKSETGFDIIFTRIKNPDDSFYNKMVLNIFYSVFNPISKEGQNIAIENSGVFCLINRNALNALLKIQDYHREYPLILRWIGFNSTYMEVERRHRPIGKNSYNLKSIAAQIVTSGITQSNRLLYVFVSAGFVIFILSLIGVVLLVFAFLISGFSEGWPSLMVLLLLSIGLILSSLSITGLYLAKIFDQVKNRPSYLIDKKINF